MAEKESQYQTLTIESGATELENQLATINNRWPELLSAQDIQRRFLQLDKDKTIFQSELLTSQQQVDPA